MLDYFRVYYVQVQFGYAYIITSIMFVVCASLLLNDFPKDLKIITKKLLEIIIGIFVLIMLNGIFYRVLGFGNSMIIEGIYLFLYSVFVSKYKTTTKIVVSSIFYCTNLLTLILSSATTLTLKEIGYESILISGKFDVTCIIVIFMLSAMTIFLKKFSTEKLTFIPRSYVLLIVAVSAISFIIFNLEIKDTIEYFYMIIIALSFWSLDIVSYGMFYIISRDYNEKLTLDILKHKAEAECNLFKNSMKNYEEMRLLRHELKNYFSYAEILLEQKKYNKLHEYFANIQEKVNSLVENYDYGNIVINSVLSNMILKAKSKNINIITDIKVPEILPIEDSELFSLLSNIIDNAIEACVRERYRSADIKVSIKQFERYLFIKVINPVSDNIPRDERLQLKTSKVNKQMHGLGTKIINSIIEKNKGSINYGISEGNFIVNAMIDSNIEKFRVGEKVNGESESCYL